MSDTMLLGVLRMPFDLAMATLTAQIQYHQRGVQAADEIEKLTRERDEARAEVEKLREAMTDMLSGWRYIRETYGDLAGIGWDRVEQKARETLEAKP